MVSRSLTETQNEVEGITTGGNVSVIVIDTDEEGSGPALHQHPYPETFVLVTGSVHFWVGDDDVIATGPSVQVAPADTPHRFAVVGGARVHMVDVHASDRFITEWLEGPLAGETDAAEREGSVR